jgi:hypothetical protein
VVHPLSEKLNGWLSAVELLLGHVEVIDEDAVLLACGWAVDTLSSLLELLIESVLGLVGSGLGRERDWDALELLGKLLVEELSNVDCLSSTSWSWTEDVLAVSHKKFLDELHSNGVECWHDDFIEARLSDNREWTDGVGPNHPLFLLLVVLVVID